MPTALRETTELVAGREGGWRLRGWSRGRVYAGITDRTVNIEQQLASTRLADLRPVEAEQVHDSSTGIIEGTVSTGRIRGCDALVTSQIRVPLLIRTADCLPIFFCEPSRGVIALAHAGWRGLAAGLPQKVLSILRWRYGIEPGEVDVAIGPSIRVCCYEVGAEFRQRFGGFVKTEAGRTVCDLIGAAKAQLEGAGVRPGRLFDGGHCTFCESDRWFSLRREGAETGRLFSYIVLG